MSMNIAVHIDRLVLDGLLVSHRQGLSVKAAVEEELGRLLTSGEPSSALLAGGALASLKVGSIRLSDESNPMQLGEQIARAVYEGVGQS